jgi:succinate-semialdehyde dehydrogenase / glutarate-semialdehyde dehydrogenase
MAEGTDIGPLIDERAVSKVSEHVSDAINQGASLICGGKSSGRFFSPTILMNTTSSMKVMREETFGPVAAVCTFSDEDEVIAAANLTDSALAAYFYAKDSSRVWRVSEALEYGMIGINSGLLSTEIAPFGGIKQSGLGVEGSKYGLSEYLETKYLCSRLL